MYQCSAFVWRTILRKHSACSLGTRLGPWLCLNIVLNMHSEPQTCQCGHVSPHHSPYIDMLRSLPWDNWHGHLSLTDGPFAQFPPNKLSILWNNLANPMCFRSVCASKEWRVLDFIISQKSCLCSPFRHTSQILSAPDRCCASWEWHIFVYLISQELCSRSPFRHTSRDNIARVQSQHTGQTWTCTPKRQLSSKLCLVRLGLREDFLRTFSGPLLSFYFKWPLCLRGTNLLLVLHSFANFHKCLRKGAMSVNQTALACSGPPLSSDVLNACIGRVAYVSTLMSLQQHGQTRPD